LPVSQRDQFPFGILMNRPRSGSQNGSALDQPCSQQQKHNPATELASCRGFSFMRRRHHKLAATTYQIKMVFMAIHKFYRWQTSIHAKVSNADIILIKS
jgi:hypothetical protein